MDPGPDWKTRNIFAIEFAAVYTISPKGSKISSVGYVFGEDSKLDLWSYAFFFEKKLRFPNDWYKDRIKRRPLLFPDLLPYNGLNILTSKLSRLVLQLLFTFKTSPSRRKGKQTKLLCLEIMLSASLEILFQLQGSEILPEFSPWCLKIVGQVNLYGRPLLLRSMDFVN